MNEETEDDIEEADGEITPIVPEVDPFDLMDAKVRITFERGNAVREARVGIQDDIREFVADLVNLYPGHEDSIRKGLEGMAANLLARRDERKRNERKAKQPSKDNSDGQVKSPGANGVSPSVHGVLQGDVGPGPANDGDAEGSG